MKTPMIAQIVGALVNIALDTLFIFGLFGLPKLGIYAGAAIANCCGTDCCGSSYCNEKGFASLHRFRCIRGISVLFINLDSNILMQSAYTLYILWFLNLNVAFFRSGSYGADFITSDHFSLFRWGTADLYCAGDQL